MQNRGILAKNSSIETYSAINLYPLVLPSTITTRLETVNLLTYQTYGKRSKSCNSLKGVKSPVVDNVPVERSNRVGKKQLSLSYAEGSGNAKMAAKKET